VPQLTVRGVEAEKLAVVSHAMAEEMADICGCGTDNFTIYRLPVEAVYGDAGGYAFVEVAWFERGSMVRDRLAEAIARHISAVGVPEVEVAFKVYSEDAYYVNGVSCGKI
jgi:hypothetical protein